MLLFIRRLLDPYGLWDGPATLRVFDRDGVEVLRCREGEDVVYIRRPKSGTVVFVEDDTPFPPLPD